MLERAVGNLLEADVDALVNTVNTVGVMGKGIALQFKRAFPDNFAVYERACRAGEVEFRPYLYGPYADALRKVLRHIEGHYTQGVGDGRNSPTTEISLLPGAAEEAEAFLREREDTSARLRRVASLIEGFESPFGMELLATVHWVREHEGAGTVDEAVQRVGAWSGRKRSLMKPGHIRAAWERLEEVGHPRDQGLPQPEEPASTLC